MACTFGTASHLIPALRTFAAHLNYLRGKCVDLHKWENPLLAMRPDQVKYKQSSHSKHICCRASANVAGRVFEASQNCDNFETNSALLFALMPLDT